MIDKKLSDCEQIQELQRQVEVLQKQLRELQKKNQNLKKEGSLEISVEGIRRLVPIEVIKETKSKTLPESSPDSTCPIKPPLPLLEWLRNVKQPTKFNFKVKGIKKLASIAYIKDAKEKNKSLEDNKYNEQIKLAENPLLKKSSKERLILNSIPHGSKEVLEISLNVICVSLLYLIRDSYQGPESKSQLKQSDLKCPENIRKQYILHTNDQKQILDQVLNQRFRVHRKSLIPRPVRLSNLKSNESLKSSNPKFHA